MGDNQYFVKRLSLGIHKNRVCQIYIAILYFLLAIIDYKRIYLKSYMDYVNRFNFQQVMIIYTIPLAVLVLVNEKLINYIKRYLVIYIKEVKYYLYTILKEICMLHIIAFCGGQCLGMMMHIVHDSNIPIVLWCVNLIIVAVEIISAIVLLMGLILLFRKNLIACLAYYLIIIVLGGVNSIYCALPLNAGLLITEQYYRYFGIPLWIGRIGVLLFTCMIFIIGLNKINRYIKDQ